MPYEHIEQIHERKGEKVALMLTAEKFGLRDRRESYVLKHGSVAVGNMEHSLRLICWAS